MRFKPEVLSEYKAVLGEGPVWDGRRGGLYWIDSLDNKACFFDPATGENTVWDVGQNIGTLILTEKDNELIVGLTDGLYLLNTDTGELSFGCDPEPGLSGNRLNDGKADSMGRIWIGSMCIADNGETGEDSSCKCGLHRVETDFSFKAVDTDIRLANGMAWSGDNKTLYFIDSPTQSVYAYDFDAEKGSISGRRVCISIPTELGVCDGMDIDTDGNLWIAHWTGWCVAKWDPRTGELLDKIELPVSRVASCAFGGKNYDELYIVTASVNADKDEIKQPLAGSIFVVKNTGARGLPFNRFKPREK